MYYDIYILGCLMQRPHHGYEIKKKLTNAMSACTSISNNSLYPILRKYEQAGATTRRVEQHPGAPDRVVYEITDTGRRMFVDALWHFPDALILSREDFCMRLFYFEFLSREARERVIGLREAYVQRGLRLLAGERRVEGGPYIPHEPEMAAFHRELLLLEQRLLDRYKQRLDEPCRIDGDGHLTGDFPA